MPINQERTLVERAPSVLERSVLERTIILVIEDEAVVAVFEHETAPIKTPMPKPVSTTTSQDIPTTPTTAKTLLLLTSSSQFDRTTTQAISDSTKSSTGATKKLSSGATLNVEAFPDVAIVQMDLLLANQHTIMANQCELKAHQQALERRMDRWKIYYFKY